MPPHWALKSLNSNAFGAFLDPKGLHLAQGRGFQSNALPCLVNDEPPLQHYSKDDNYRSGYVQHGARGLLVPEILNRFFQVIGGT